MKNIFLVILFVNINLTIITQNHFAFRRIKGNIIVKFRDENFEKAVREAIQKPEGELTIADLQTIQALNLSGKGIKDISGIEYMENLKWLDLSNNQISNLSFLTPLLEAGERIRLEWLDLSDNQITDLSLLRTLLESGRVKGINVVGNPLTVKDLQFLTVWAGHNPLNLRLIMKLEQTGFILAEIQRDFFIYTDGMFKIWEKDGRIVKLGNARSGKILLADPKGDLNITDFDVREKFGEKRLLLYGKEIILVTPDVILDARPAP